MDNKSKTSLIRNIQKNISLMKMNNTRARILLSSFVINYFCIYHSGSFPIVFTKGMNVKLSQKSAEV